MRDFTLIFGCMFSGKTTKLIELYNYSNAEPQEKLAIKPLIDNRYVAGSINSHSGIQLPGHRISKPEEIFPILTPEVKEIYIDEVQFLGDNITGVILDLTLQGIKVTAAGLDFDSNHENFGAMAELKKWASNSILLTAKCAVCNETARYTFRTIAAENQILIGHKNIYEARCEYHWNEGMENLQLQNKQNQ